MCSTSANAWITIVPSVLPSGDGPSSLKNVSKVESPKTYLKTQGFVPKQETWTPKIRTMSQSLQTLTDGDNEGEWDRRAVNPLSIEILGLETGMGAEFRCRN